MGCSLMNHPAFLGYPHDELEPPICGYTVLQGCRCWASLFGDHHDGHDRSEESAGAHGDQLQHPRQQQGGIKPAGWWQVCMMGDMGKMREVTNSVDELHDWGTPGNTGQEPWRSSPKLDADSLDFVWYTSNLRDIKRDNIQVEAKNDMIKLIVLLESVR